MAQAFHMPIQEGDWVSGTSPLDEKFIGYVQSVHEGGVLKIWVTQCDREEIVGTSIDTKLSKVKKMPESAAPTPEELRSMIELSLMTHDKSWFEALRAQLTEATASKEMPEVPDYQNPRLFGMARRDLI